MLFEYIGEEGFFDKIVTCLKCISHPNNIKDSDYLIRELYYHDHVSSVGEIRYNNVFSPAAGENISLNIYKNNLLLILNKCIDQRKRRFYGLGIFKPMEFQKIFLSTIKSVVEKYNLPKVVKDKEPILHYIKEGNENLLSNIYSISYKVNKLKSNCCHAEMIFNEDFGKPGVSLITGTLTECARKMNIIKAEDIKSNKLSFK